jgi:hypothetical protein
MLRPSSFPFPVKRSAASASKPQHSSRFALGTVSLGYFYYPEIENSLGNIKALRFISDQHAVDFYKHKYGKELMVVIRDCDPEITVIWKKEGKNAKAL